MNAEHVLQNCWETSHFQTLKLDCNSLSLRHSSIRPERVCVRVSLGKGESDVRSIEETFRRNPVGREPTRKSLANSRKRVLRPGGVTHRAKRRQRVPEPAHSAPKLGLVAGAPAVRACGGRACSPVLAWEGGPAGGLEAGAATLGFPRNLGGLFVPAVRFGSTGQPIHEDPGPAAASEPQRERKHRWHTVVGPLRTQ